MCPIETIRQHINIISRISDKGYITYHESIIAKYLMLLSRRGDLVADSFEESIVYGELYEVVALMDNLKLSKDFVEPSLAVIKSYVYLATKLRSKSYIEQPVAKIYMSDSEVRNSLLALYCLSKVGLLNKDLKRAASRYRHVMNKFKWVEFTSGHVDAFKFSRQLNHKVEYKFDEIEIGREYLEQVNCCVDDAKAQVYNYKFGAEPNKEYNPLVTEERYMDEGTLIKVVDSIPSIKDLTNEPQVKNLVELTIKLLGTPAIKGPLYYKAYLKLRDLNINLENAGASPNINTLVPILALALDAMEAMQESKVEYKARRSINLVRILSETKLATEALTPYALNTLSYYNKLDGASLVKKEFSSILNISIESSEDGLISYISRNSMVGVALNEVVNILRVKLRHNNTSRKGLGSRSSLAMFSEDIMIAEINRFISAKVIAPTSRNFIHTVNRLKVLMDNPVSTDTTIKCCEYLNYLITDDVRKTVIIKQLMEYMEVVLSKKDYIDKETNLDGNCILSTIFMGMCLKAKSYTNKGIYTNVHGTVILVEILRACDFLQVLADLNLLSQQDRYRIRNHLSKLRYVTPQMKVVANRLESITETDTDTSTSYYGASIVLDSLLNHHLN